MCKQVVECMKEGWSKEEVALELGVNIATIYRYAEEYPAFCEAIKQGEEYSRAWWVREGREALRDKDFNATLWYMNMKNRHGWRDKQEVSTTVTIRHEDMLKELE